jgi:hypothetical protein
MFPPALWNHYSDINSTEALTNNSSEGNSFVSLQGHHDFDQVKIEDINGRNIELSRACENCLFSL